MTDLDIPFPTRPMQVSPPGTGFSSQLGTLLFGALIAGCALLMVIPPIPDLVSDFAVRGAARPVAGAIIDGRCSVTLVLVRCKAQLLARRPGQPDLLGKVDYWFFDFGVGTYTATVVADPARPERMTTDLALEKLLNRTVTLLLLGPFFLLIGWVAIMYVSATLRARRAVVRALSNQVLRPVLLRLDRRDKYSWTVSGLTPAGAAKSCDWEAKGMPIFMDLSRNLVLGVTAGDGTACMPLDTALSWIDLNEAERARLREILGPERLGA